MDKILHFVNAWIIIIICNTFIFLRRGCYTVVRGYLPLFVCWGEGEGITKWWVSTCMLGKVHIWFPSVSRECVLCPVAPRRPGLSAGPLSPCGSGKELTHWLLCSIKHTFLQCICMWLAYWTALLLFKKKKRKKWVRTEHVHVKPVLNWVNICSPNILRTLWRTIIHFLIELLVWQTWFGQFDELYFVLNWLVMRCQLWLKLAADA